MFHRPQIITVDLTDEDVPRLSHGDNWLAYFEGAPAGDVTCGRGNTEAQAVGDLLARHPIECAA